MPSLAERSADSSGGPSRDRGVRVWLERAAQALALAIVLWWLYQSLRPAGEGATEVVALGELPAELSRWSTVSTPGRVHVRIDSAVAPATRDWLAALASSGTRVTWEGHGVLPLAAVAEPVADPAGGTRVWVGAPAGAPVLL